MRDISCQTEALVGVEKKMDVTRRVAGSFAGGTRGLLDGYGDLVAALNNTFVEWEEAIGKMERQRK